VSSEIRNYYRKISS